MKLSSTIIAEKKPALRISSSSAITCAAFFVRGTRPKITMMSQNSHWNGQPRENCSEPDA